MVVPRNIARTTFALGMVLLASSAEAVGAEPEYEVIRLADDLAGESLPRIDSQGRVAWVELAGAETRELCYYDGQTIRRIARFSARARQLELSDSGNVVWQRGADLLIWDGQEIAALVTGDDDMTQTHAVINDRNQVAWIQRTESNGRDFVQLQDGGRLIWLTADGGAYFFGPRRQINGKGQVVWSGIAPPDPRNPDHEIHFYDGDRTVVLRNPDVQDSDPQINSSGEIAWQGYVGLPRKRRPEIFLYNGSQITQITNDEYFDSDVELADDGRMAWARSVDGKDSEIVIYELGRLAQITDNNYDDDSPLLNNRGEVAWLARRYNASPQYSEVLVWKDGETIQLTNDARRKRLGGFNDHGQIVWTTELPVEQDGERRQMRVLFLATPVNLPTEKGKHASAKQKGRIQ